MIIVNYKAYRNAIGDNSVKITKKIERSETQDNVEIAIAPQTADISRIDKEDTLIFSQHLDSVETGSHTGSNQVKALKEAGIDGSIINHSEKRLEVEEIKNIVKKCRENDLISVVCAQTPEECNKMSKFEPDYIAFEPPELIGGNKAVSTAEPEMISKAVENSGRVSTLTGAGIKSKKDVQKSIELGCEGILVASGVVKADNIQKEIEELCEGL